MLLPVQPPLAVEHGWGIQRQRRVWGRRQIKLELPTRPTTCAANSAWCPRQRSFTEWKQVQLSRKPFPQKFCGFFEESINIYPEDLFSANLFSQANR